MTREEARANIGKPFRLTGYGDGLLSKFDRIKAVHESGVIVGDFIEAHCQDCQLKQPQPEQLHKARGK